MTLFMYTVYDHPLDYPDNFVVRKFAIGAGQVSPTEDVELFTTLDEVRQKMSGQGLVCLTRNPEDDSKIVETWL